MDQIDKKDYDRLQKIRENCTICKGSGYTEKQKPDGRVHLADCTCIQHISYELKMIEANIPPQYRHWTFNQLDKKIIKDRTNLPGHLIPDCVILVGIEI